MNENIEDSIIELIKQNNKITQVQMAEILNVSRDVIKRNIKKLKDSHRVEREGMSVAKIIISPITLSK